MAVTGRIRRNTRVGRYCAGKVWGVGTGDVGGYALRFGESGLCSTQWAGKVKCGKGVLLLLDTHFSAVTNRPIALSAICVYDNSNNISNKNKLKVCEGDVLLCY